MTIGRIRVGIGGWNYPPWRETFYPRDVPKARELEHASRQLTAIEINGTFYRTQSPETFAKWAQATPDGFVFSVKAHRFTTNRKDLRESQEAVAHFLDSGLLALGDRLGPILWQLAPTKKFDAGEIETFLSYLPREQEGRRLHHALEARHASFRDPAFIALAEKANVAVVFAHSDKHAELYDVTSDFVYARLQKTRSEEPTGYSPDELAVWAQRIATWAEGGAPDDLPRIVEGSVPKQPRDCFVFMISGAKERAPAAAMALMNRLGLSATEGA